MTTDQTRAALHWTAPIEPDLPAPTMPDAYTIGYFFNAFDGRVFDMWSSDRYHGLGREPMKGSWRGSKALYKTRLAALQAMRYQVAKNAAEQLEKIDSLIEFEKGKKS